MAASTKLRLIADENDLQAVRTDPSGFLYAVLQVLRDPDNFGEADFAALIERGRLYAQTQGGMLRHAQDVAGARAKEMAPQIQDIRTGRPKAKAIGKPKAKARTHSADTVVYADTEEEEERMAEAQRLQATLTQPEDYEVEEDEVIAVDEQAITLTNDQLQRLLRNVAATAIAGAQAPGAFAGSATPQMENPEDRVGDEDEEGDPEEEEDEEEEAVPPTPGEPQPEAEETRGRDDSGRFVTKK